MSELPAWLADPALAEVWERARRRLEATRLEARGRIRVPLRGRAERHAVSALLGRAVTREVVTLDLAALDARLRERSGVGGVVEVVAVVTGAPLRDRVVDRTARAEARERPLQLAREAAPNEPWVDDWIGGLRRSGLLTGRGDAERVADDAGAVLRELVGDAGRTPRSRVELAAETLGDAHALDRDRLLHQVVLRGLAAAAGEPVPDGARSRDLLWRRFGVEPDLLSRTCLALGLRPDGADPVSERLRDAAAAGDPVHITEWDLRRMSGGFGADRVLVCENPRVVEAFAERGRAGDAVVCTSGEPNLVVDEVLGGLARSGADLRSHGDFDWGGVAIANRLVARIGVRPWRMSADDYLAAVRPDAPALTGMPVQPVWDAELGAAMRVQGRAVHEESVLAQLVDAWDE